MSGFRAWLLEGLAERAAAMQGPHGKAEEHNARPWYQVMCLTRMVSTPAVTRGADPLSRS